MSAPSEPEHSALPTPTAPADGSPAPSPAAGLDAPVDGSGAAEPAAAPVRAVRRRRVRADPGVEQYLAALDRDRLQRRLMLLSVLLQSAGEAQQASLAVERLQIRELLVRFDGLGPVDDYEAAFLVAVPAFLAQHRVTRPAWLQMGVAADVLDRAGIVS